MELQVATFWWAMGAAKISRAPRGSWQFYEKIFQKDLR
jgi:hypothetical protein